MRARWFFAGRTFVVCGLVVASTTSCFAQFGFVPDKLPVPPNAKLESAAVIVREVYRKQFEDAQSPRAMSRVAMQILTDANATQGDPVARYVMLRSAREVAIRAGDVTTALATVDAMRDSYRIDELSVGTKALVGALKRTTREPSGDVQQAILAFAGRLIDADEYANAFQVLGAAMRRTRSTLSRRELESVLRRAEKLSSSYSKLQASQAGRNPFSGDAASKCERGRFLCFVKGDFINGLPLLEKCEDEPLRQLAVLERSFDGSASDALNLADRWWKYADAQTGDLRAGARRHAGTFYLEATRTLTGLRKAKAMHRLREARAAGDVKSLAVIRGYFNDGPGLHDPVAMP